ncbi:MAG: GlsB/YeaQ/YmgE family stress response membrane protein [Chloroflexota bacterium]
MGWVAWIVVGAIAGYLASKLVGSNEGLIMMIVYGIVGGLLGGWVAANVFKIGSMDRISIESILIATVGAAVLLLVMNKAGGMRGLRRS